MFTTHLESFDEVIEEAKKSHHVINKELKKLNKIVINYIKTNKLLLSNIDMLLKVDTNINNFIIYGKNILIHANRLANELAKHTIYIKLYTNVKNMDFNISLNGLSYIQLYNLGESIKSISPIKNDLLLYPPELELINVYHKLYSPVYFDDWDLLDVNRKKLETLLFTRKNIIGGKIKNKNKFNNRFILNWLKNKENIILIGQNAINIISGNNIYYNKVQIITDIKINALIPIIDKLVQKNTGYKVTHKSSYINLYSEFRLIKTTVSISININGKKKNIYIMDIYNSTTFELVPYYTYKDINIGFHNVLKMYLLLDLYNTIMISKGKSNNIIKLIANNSINNIKRINELKNFTYKEESYMGVHIDIYKIKKKIGTDNIYYPYVPESYRYKNGKYRVIEN